MKFAEASRASLIIGSPTTSNGGAGVVSETDSEELEPVVDTLVGDFLGASPSL